MRVSQEEKDRSHQRVITSAARLVRELGIDGASVSDIMKDAGLTHGGFYKHFESKEALLIAALDQAFEETAARIGSGPDSFGPSGAGQTFQDIYLSDGHFVSTGIGCPIAALGNDVARSTAAVKARFGAGVRRIVTLLARATSGPERARRARATRQLAMMAGALMIARACDPETAREVLDACRE